MEKIKAFCKKLLYPPVWVIIIVTVISAAGLTVVFINGLDAHPVAYALYAISAYALTVICVLCIKVFPRLKKTVRNIPYAERFLTDIDFKSRVSLYPSLAVNLLYVITNLFSGIYYRSYWFLTLSAYYVILTVLRFILLRYMRRNSLGENRLPELKRSVGCAAVLLLLTFVLSGVVTLYIRDNEHFEYAGFLIYAMAAYTFYVTTAAVVNLVKYRRYNSPLLLTSKTVSLAAALVSMLSLEMAMLAQFSAENRSEYFNRIMVGATGAGIALILLGMSMFVIVRANKEIKKINNSLT
ncbi:MAG: hypothetical protein HDT47_04220 [Ruminococcaceae bacterium]|nr:hypothetical protein [Oscillospiraceae bacterium]